MAHKVRVTIALTGALYLAAAAGQESRHRWSVELALDATSSESSGKLSASPDGEFARIAFEYSGSIKPTLTVNAVVDAVDDGTPGIDVTEAFLRWQPVPRSPFRHELRAGIFYPPMSLENSGAAWTSPYSTSFSAINTWIGEEIRTTGAEWSVSRALGPRASQREIRLLGAAFYGNDPAGTLLAWRGWAVHQRQSRSDDAILLPAVPQIQPSGWFRRQAPHTRPFDEVDHALGFYYGAEWRLGRRILLAAMHYDNHADPQVIREGQYGWTTRFDHVGAQFELPSDLGLIVQWMDGTTEMGPYINGRAPCITVSMRISRC